MSALQVAHVVCSEAFAGVERYVLNSALALASAACTVTVVGGAAASMQSTLAERGIAWMPARSVRDAIGALRQINGIDVINTHMTSADFAGATVGIVRGIPVVSTRHFAAKRGHGAVNRALGAVLQGSIADQIATSRFVADAIEGTSTVIHAGATNVADIDDLARNQIVLVLQRLEAEKCTATALQAWAAVGNVDGWRLVVAGEGSEDAALRRLAHDLGIASSVDFIGFQSDVEAVLRRASIMLASAPSEPFGLSVLEAMAHGLPVVAARGGGHLETVGSVPNAALFDDAPGAGRLLAHLMADDAARHSYGRELRTRQREAFSVEAQTAGTLRVLRSAVESSRRRHTR
ncbi:MAG: glycosyltransferase family 4 protein [Lacisediminihabitans sp.]